MVTVTRTFANGCEDAETISDKEQVAMRVQAHEVVSYAAATQSQRSVNSAEVAPVPHQRTWKGC